MDIEEAAFKKAQTEAEYSNILMKLERTLAKECKFLNIF